MNKRSGRPRAEGQLNRSQVITTYGPGAMVDLPEEAVLISGLDRWAEGAEIHDVRLVRHLRRHLQVPYLILREPRLDDEIEERTAPGMHGLVFPGWFVANIEKTITRNGRTYRTRPLYKIGEVKAGKVLYTNEDEETKKVSVSPVRFVRACDDGHLSDIDWYYFLFGPENKAYHDKRLWLDEGGAGNDLSEVYIRCEGKGGKIQSLGNAALPDSHILGPCQGGLPWLAYDAREPCKHKKMSKLLIRSASNAYFTKVLTTISLPETESELDRLLVPVWDWVKKLQDLDRLRFLLEMDPMTQLREAFEPEEIWRTILKKRGNEPEEEKLTLKDEELKTLLSQPDEVGGENPDQRGDNAEPFLARNRRLDNVEPWLRDRLDRIVLVHRLREVMVQVGFTRFVPDMPEINGEYRQIKSPPLAPDGDLKWLPAVENQGEGVFLAFKTEAIEAWAARDRVKNRIADLERGFKKWQKRKDQFDRAFPDPAYYMLHSLSHLLITAVALECGYSATAIKERIYAGPNGYGILLYTWSPSSEGTLGGLIEVARRIETSLEYALELGELCSNDPVCAYHEPHNEHEERFLSGAACHGCLLISEPCCEQGNELLDRALVIPTVECKDAAFFSLEDL